MVLLPSLTDKYERIVNILWLKNSVHSAAYNQIIAFFHSHFPQQNQVFYSIAYVSSCSECRTSGDKISYPPSK